ncbi:hypothetical protein P879_00869 [Paragonimus westermani]|uniref:Uncharacterized protein n=1 Tax=Paragonimus westermani TaxID=34504 RepID=A0A8T0DQY0_9TREM|nr:hypothetical protein P879_00869 [Paragonimus westermani]
MMHQELLKKASPLHYYCMTGDIQSLTELMGQNEEDVCTMDDLHYWTPAHWAASFNRDYQGDTPLHKAARGGHIGCVNLLVHAGARVKIQSAQVTCDVSSRAPLCIPDRPSNCCKRQNLNDFDELLDKRRKFTDPVLQLATDMLGAVGTGDPCALQSSVLEHAACMNMADTYANHYFSYLESDKTRCP